MKTIYYNAKVYTGSGRFAEAFVVEGDTFIYAGKTDTAMAEYGACAEKVDLNGAFVCPGFNDSHMHLLNYGNAISVADLSENSGSLEGMIQYFRGFAQSDAAVERGWIVGRGWNQDYFSDCARMPDRYDLDRVSTDLPVIAIRCCGHALVVNSRLLEMLSVTADTHQPEGGAIGICDGAPDGRFFDNAMDMVYSAIPAPDKAMVKQHLIRACAKLNSYGVTSCQSDDFLSLGNLSWRTVNEAYRELEESGELTVRVYEQCNFTDAESLETFIREGNVTGCGSYMYKTGPLKMLGDGALGARTALLSIPYADASDTMGLPVFSKQTLENMIGIAHRNGMQCAVHAIGDRCLDWVLDAYEKALAELPRKDHRHGIVHCQITRPDQLDRITRLGLHIYAQTIFIDYDSRIVRARIGDELAESSYNWKTLMNNGVSVSNGTDCPVEKPDALRGMQCAVTRCSLDGGEPYLPGQAFSVAEAIDSYTVRGAEASFEEGIKGSIKPGMLADFAILAEDPFDVPADKISGIPIIATYLGGRCVYGK